jgi:hypothetical protein
VTTGETENLRAAIRMYDACWLISRLGLLHGCLGNVQVPIGDRVFLEFLERCPIGRVPRSASPDFDRFKRRVLVLSFDVLAGRK